MQAFVVLALASALSVASAPSLAETKAPAEAERPVPRPAAKKPLGEQTMDELYATLANASDAAQGKAAEQEIQRRWWRSDSATIDLLMGWAQESLVAKDYGRALDFLDSVVMLKPGYAEGWNRRATIYYLVDDYGKALADLEKVLALEPRHFRALAGIGMIFRDIDRKAEALEAFEKAVALDPYLEGDVRNAIKSLTPAVHGKDI